MVIKTGHTSLLLRDALRRPLAELELGAVQASLRRPTQTVMQFYCGIYISAWSYNPTISAWEPVLESWDLIVKADANRSSQVEAFILAVSLRPWSSNEHSNLHLQPFLQDLMLSYRKH